MNFYAIAIIVIMLFLGFLLFRSCSSNDALADYASVKTEPLKEKKKYKDEVDYFMTPLAKAMRIENAAPKKKNQRGLYENYNEAIARYNLVGDKVKSHPKVPNIETVVGQRDRAYMELLAMTEEPEPVPTVATLHQLMREIEEIIPTVAPPVPVLKEKKRANRLHIKIKASPQNVHDNKLGDELSSRYKLLKRSDLAPSTTELHKDMLDFINKHDKHNKIVKGLNEDTISRFDNASENDIWYTVWRRIHSPENDTCRGDLKNSLRDAVSDCTEHNSLVCTTGRVTRALDSLTLMDKNPLLAKPALTDDIARKEVYSQAHGILQRELNAMGDKFKNSYESGELEDTPAFDEKVRNQIRKEVGKSKYLDDALAAI